MRSARTPGETHATFWSVKGESMLELAAGDYMILWVHPRTTMWDISAIADASRVITTDTPPPPPPPNLIPRTDRRDEIQHGT